MLCKGFLTFRSWGGQWNCVGGTVSIVVCYITSMRCGLRPSFLIQEVVCRAMLLMEGDET